jgi:plasmid stability protein
MPYVFNLVSKTLAPMPSHPGADPMEFISKDAIVVSNEQARQIGKADAKELERITMHILGKRLMRDQSMSAEHRKILEAGMKALGTDDLSEVAKDKPAEDAIEAEDETLSMTLDTGNSSALLSKAQVSRIRSHSTILKYAREVLGLDVLDNETFEVLKRKVLAHQFGEEA